MARKNSSLSLIIFGCLLGTTSVHADSRFCKNGKNPYWLSVQTHAGEMDTDGILSAGELRNPRINYDNVKKEAERVSDYRVDNPYNDDAAANDRRYDRSDGSRDYYRERAERERYEQEMRDREQWDRRHR